MISAIRITKSWKYLQLAISCLKLEDWKNLCKLCIASLTCTSNCFCYNISSNSNKQRQTLIHPSPIHCHMACFSQRRLVRNLHKFAFLRTREFRDHLLMCLLCSPRKLDLTSILVLFKHRSGRLFNSSQRQAWRKIRVQAAPTHPCNTQPNLLKKEAAFARQTMLSVWSCNSKWWMLEMRHVSGLTVQPYGELRCSGAGFLKFWLWLCVCNKIICSVPDSMSRG
jgi:hypothetical protein